MRAVPPRAISEPEPEPELVGAAVTATVNFPIYLMDVEFPENATTQEKQAQLARLALEVLQKHGTPEPVIQECSDEDLVE